MLAGIRKRNQNAISEKDHSSIKNTKSLKGSNPDVKKIHNILDIRSGDGFNSNTDLDSGSNAKVVALRARQKRKRITVSATPKLSIPNSPSSKLQDNLKRNRMSIIERRQTLRREQSAAILSKPKYLEM